MAAALVVLSSGDDQIELRGTMYLLDTEVEGDLEDCQGGGGYSDIGSGTSIKITDADGTIIGTGTTT